MFNLAVNHYLGCDGDVTKVSTSELTAGTTFPVNLEVIEVVGRISFITRNRIVTSNLPQCVLTYLFQTVTSSFVKSGKWGRIIPRLGVKLKGSRLPFALGF